MAGKKRNGAPMSKKMLDARKSRLLDKTKMLSPDNNNNNQKQNIVKVDRYYLKEIEDGVQVQYKDNK